MIARTITARLTSWIGATLPIAAAVIFLAAAPSSAQEPIKIGFSVSLTGGLASSGKANLLAQQIWAEEINAKGGLLGRPVKLVYYDDQTNAATVPGIYAKLLDIDLDRPRTAKTLASAHFGVLCDQVRAVFGPGSPLLAGE